MADTFGEIEVAPLADDAATGSITDPAMVVLLGYFQAFLNTYCAAAWAAVAPGTPTNPALPVKTISTADPKKAGFNEKELPAMYLNRTQQVQPPIWWAADWYVTEDTVNLLWIFPPAPQEKQNLRANFVNGIYKSIAVAIERERDPSFVIQGDEDTTAATLQPLPTAIMSAVATSTSPQTYSGAQFNGAIGQGEIAPNRALTITCTGPAGNFAIGSLVTIALLNILGLASTQTLTITGPGTFSTTIGAKSVTSVSVAAQTGTGGTIAIGVGGYQGLGSVVRNFCGLMSLFIAKWACAVVTIQMADGSSARNYEALSMDLTIREKLEYDLTDTKRFVPQTKIDISYLLSDGSVSEQQSLPDNSGD